MAAVAVSDTNRGCNHTAQPWGTMEILNHRFRFTDTAD